MELEVGVRQTRDAGDLTFASTETEAVFILAAHLPGFTEDEIEAVMKEGESQISIRGGGRVACREAVITGRVAITRQVSVECFDESFPVPDSVDWDGIDAWFDEEEEILIISVPKLLANEYPIEEFVRGEAREPTEEKNGESWLEEREKMKELQAPAPLMPHLPPMPGESIRLSPAEEQTRAGEAEEEEDEVAREHITPKGKRPTQTEAKMAAMKDDLTEAETPKNTEYGGSEHEVPTMRPMDKEQAAKVLQEPRERWHVIEVQQKYKTLHITEPETREPLKVKRTAQQFHGQSDEDDQNQEKPGVEGRDQALETERLIESKKEYEDIQIEECREIKRVNPQVKAADEVIELPLNEKDEEKIIGGTAYEKPLAAERPEIELQGTKQDEEPKVTGPDREKTTSIETKELKPPKEIEARERVWPAVELRLSDKPGIQPPKELEGPMLRLFMEEESKEQSEQLDEEEAQKKESPVQEQARSGAILEPPDRAARAKITVTEQELYRFEEGGLEQDIERDNTTVEPSKPLPRIRGIMEVEGSPLLLNMEKEATEPTIPPPRIRGGMETEVSPLQPPPDEDAIECEFPALIQKELHPNSNLQKTEEQEDASHQMTGFKEAAEEQEGKTKEPSQREIERPTEELPHKIFEVPHQMKKCEVELKLYTPKELEYEKEENPPSPLDHDVKTLEEVSNNEAEASGKEMDKSPMVRKSSKLCRFHCRCQERCPAFLIPPFTLLSGSAFVFSIIVLVFHFKRKKSK